jgi:hypothetical protein
MPSWRIESDPLPIEQGGFSRGAEFTSYEAAYTLMYSGFTPGTVLKYLGESYVVRRAGLLIGPGEKRWRLERFGGLVEE